MKRLLGFIKTKAGNLRKEITALYYCFNDPRVKALPRILMAVTLAYALSPVDLIPDFIPVLGYLDDLLILPALIVLCIRLVPPEILEENRLRARQEPIRHRKNWIMGSLVISIWISVAIVITMMIIQAP
jgi:uncharacterized membrane protein YkvA (DUF1232 family)